MGKRTKRMKGLVVCWGCCTGFIVVKTELEGNALD